MLTYYKMAHPFRHSAEGLLHLPAQSQDDGGDTITLGEQYRAVEEQQLVFISYFSSRCSSSAAVLGRPANEKHLQS